ncbi:MAG: 30S ribosomal protein S2 [Clostridia bacterium]|nr:30S ribosomal protein S2 [Clostridia bacterium]
MSVISIKQLLEAGVQFGHPTRQWNPKMKQYIFVARNDTHIIDLEQTVVLAEQAYNYVCNMVKQGKNVLFVGTKKQATDAIKEEAERCGMYYVNNRWLGGTLTNFKTIRSRVDRLNKLTQMEKTGEFEFFPKKEVLSMRAEMEKLERNLGGIKDMTSLPGLLFVVDLKKESIALKEAKALGIPVVGLVDTNCDPELVDVVIPGNDDAIRSVKLIAELVANAVIEAKTGEVYSIKEEDMSQEEVEKAMISQDKPKEEKKETAEEPAKKPRKTVAKKATETVEKEEKKTEKKAKAEKENTEQKSE